MDEKDLLEKEEDVLEEAEKEENSEEVNLNEVKIYELDLKIQEIEITLEQLELEVLNDPENDELYQKFLDVKAEYKALRKERKEIVKEERAKDTSKLNQVSMWIIVYGFLMFVFSFPLISGSLWLDFANVVINLVTDSIANLTSDHAMYKVLVFLIIFSLPLLINLVTWLLYVNLVKKKEDKKAYIIAWLIQGLMSLGVIIYMCIELYGA